MLNKEEDKNPSQEDNKGEASSTLVTNPTHLVYPANTVNPDYILSMDIDKINQVFHQLEYYDDKTKHEIIKKIIQVAGICVCHPAVKKILVDFAKVMQNPNDCKVVYSIRKIGYIWEGKLIEFGMNKETVKRCFTRLGKLRFIEPANSNDIENSKLGLVFPSYSHLKQARIKKLTEYGVNLFKKADLEVDETFKQKVDEFSDFLNSINPQEAGTIIMERKIKRMRKDPLFKWWLKLDEYIESKGVKNRTINANITKSISGITPRVLRRLEGANYIVSIETPSVIKYFYVKTIAEIYQKPEGENEI